MDGFTVPLTASASLNGLLGASYHAKIAIADALDTNLDSNVFIKGASFKCIPQIPCQQGFPGCCACDGSVKVSPCCAADGSVLQGSCCDADGPLTDHCCDNGAVAVGTGGCCDGSGSIIDDNVNCCTFTGSAPAEPLSNDCCNYGTPESDAVLELNPCCGSSGAFVTSACCDGNGFPPGFDGIAPEDMKPNHFAYRVDSTPEFYKLPPKGNGGGYPDDFTISDTFGCSCTAIVDICGYGAVHKEKGCPPSDLEAAVLSCDGGLLSECVEAGHECISTLVGGQKICCKAD